MRDARFAHYAWLWVFGVALGYFEAAVVVYLRELYYPDGFRFPVVLISTRLAVVEITREVASVALLAAAARLAATRFLDRFAVFMLLFGIWDLVYYAVLRVVIGWPQHLGDWDVLFLIPVPWVGPVWAPVAVSTALVVAGSRLYWTAERPRLLHGSDWALAILGGLIVIASMLAEWRVVPEQRVPEVFPAGVFWTGMALGVAAFVRAERRLPPATTSP
jgi:hypothetical protein